ncbi:hypothetical protein AAF712_015398, partial [Marasmius tenuissimus]
VALGYINFKITRDEKASNTTTYNSDSESDQDGSSFRSELVLYNHRVQLTSNVLGMGVTDKRGDDLDLIGGHGEGMKVGILALVRNGHEVNYYTSGERWKFVISSRRKQSPPELRAVITPNTAHKNHEGLRVTVKGLKMEQLNDYFDGILFLHPPPPDTILQTRQPSTSSRGYICVGEKYLSKLYCKGLFVRDYKENMQADVDDDLSDDDDSESDTTRPDRNCLHYGYDLLRDLKLGRDRDIPSATDITQLVMLLWINLLAEEVYDLQALSSPAERPTPLADRFLDLYEDDPRCVDIADARWFLGKKYGDPNASRVVRHLWSTYRARKRKEHNDTDIWVYDPRLNDAEEQQKIIRSLSAVSVTPPDDLLKLFQDYKLVRSPDEEQKRRFKSLPDSTNTSSIFAQHARHLINITRDSQTALQGHSCSWRCDSGTDGMALDLDVFIADNTLFLNDRNLSFEFVHSAEKGGSTSCPALDPNTDPNVLSIVCDCSVQSLVNQIVQNCYPKASNRQLSKHLRDMNNLFLLLPRNISFTYKSSDDPSRAGQHPLDVNIRWSTQVHEASNFILELQSGKDSLNRTIKEPESDHSSEEAPTSTTNVQSISSTILTSIDPFISLPNLVPGETYNVQVCARRTTRVAYSVPRVLECPLDRVRNLTATVANKELVVQFASVLHSVRYVITVLFANAEEEVFDTLDTKWAHEIGDLQAKSVSVVGISSRGVRSFEESTIRPQSIIPTPPREPSEDGVAAAGHTMDHPIVLQGDPDSDSDFEMELIPHTPARGTRSVSDGELFQTPLQRSVGGSTSASGKQPSATARVRAPPSHTAISVVPHIATSFSTRQPVPQQQPTNLSPRCDNLLPTPPPTISPSSSQAGSGVEGKEDEDDDWIPENLVEPLQPHSSDGTTGTVRYHEYPSAVVGQYKISKDDWVEVQFGKSSAARGRRFVHFLLYIDGIWLKRTGGHDQRVLQCRRYLSESDFRNPSLFQDPTKFCRFKDLSTKDRELFLVDPAGSPCVDVPVDDIADIISVHNEYHGVAPEFQDSKTCSFSCRWGVGLHPTSRYLAFLLDDDAPLALPPKPRSCGVADFRCGAGGFSQGFVESGWDVHVGVDPDGGACNTFKFNRPVADIHHTQVDTFLTEVRKGHIYQPRPTYAVALMSQPTLQAGPASLTDTSHDWQALNTCSQVADDLDAHHILVEGNIGLVRPRNLHHLHQLMISLKRVGRQCLLAVLDAADFGAPTFRRRVYLAASKVGLTVPNFPTPTHGKSRLPYVTVREAIGDLDLKNPRTDRNTGNPIFFAHREVGKYALSMGATDIIENHAMSDIAGDWLVAEWDQPLGSLRPVYNNQWRCVHPSKTRAFSPRELARMMGFPDEYSFSGGVKAQIEQIGNAKVCPLVAQAFGETFRDALLHDYPGLVLHDSGQDDVIAEVVQDSLNDVPELGTQKRGLDDGGRSDITRKRSRHY